MRRRSTLKRILLVDDDEILRELMRLLLEDEGYAVDECVDGEKGLHALEAVDYQLVIADLRMPVMDGARFLREAVKRGFTIPPVIIFSGNSGDEVTDELESLPVSLVLNKPVNPDELLRVVREII